MSLHTKSDSRDRVHKERAMRRAKLKMLWKRLDELQSQKRLPRDELLLKPGRAQEGAGRAFDLVDLHLPAPDEAVRAQTFTFTLRQDKLREVLRWEGRSLLRTNLAGSDPAQWWQFYLQLVEIEAAFKNLKDDLSLRPIFH